MLFAEEDPFPRSDGSVDWVHWEIRPWYDENKEIGGVVLFSDLVTEQVLAREKLKHSQALLIEAQRIGQIGYMEWNAIDI